MGGKDGVRGEGKRGTGRREGTMRRRNERRSEGKGEGRSEEVDWNGIKGGNVQNEEGDEVRA